MATCTLHIYVQLDITRLQVQPVLNHNRSMTMTTTPPTTTGNTVLTPRRRKVKHGAHCDALLLALREGQPPLTILQQLSILNILSSNYLRWVSAANHASTSRSIDNSLTTNSSAQRRWWHGARGGDDIQ